MSLEATLSQAICAMWPRRAQQELLLDLGEHKAWTEADRASAIRALSGFLVEALGLPAQLPKRSPARSAARLPGIRPPAAAAERGVSAGLVSLAPLTGSSPKTLANALSGGLQPHRPDHRWLAVIARAEDQGLSLDALLFHRRSPGAVAADLDGLHAGALDAGDALLVISLVALWQRRRPTHEPRASRHRPTPRASAAKPIAALGAPLMKLGQLRPLLRHALLLPAPAGRALASVSVEAALTEAHFAPHRARRGGPAQSGEPWLQAVEQALRVPEIDVLLDDVERRALPRRLERLRAYAEGRPPAPEPPAPAGGYEALCAAIDRRRAGLEPTERFHPEAPGALMLLPQARRLGLLLEP